MDGGMPRLAGWASILQAPLFDLRQELQRRFLPPLIPGGHRKKFGPDCVGASRLKSKGILALAVGSPFDKGIFELLPYLIRNGWACGIVDETEPCGYSLKITELSDDLRKQSSLCRCQFGLTEPKQSPLNTLVPPSQIDDAGHKNVL